MQYSSDRKLYQASWIDFDQDAPLALHMISSVQWIIEGDKPTWSPKPMTEPASSYRQKSSCTTVRAARGRHEIYPQIHDWENMGSVKCRSSYYRKMDILHIKGIKCRSSFHLRRSWFKHVKDYDRCSLQLCNRLRTQRYVSVRTGSELGSNINVVLHSDMYMCNWGLFHPLRGYTV